MAKSTSRASRLNEIASQLSALASDVETLKEEMQNWLDGLSGTNLENSNKYSMLEECVSALESIHDEIENASSECDSVEFPTMYS